MSDEIETIDKNPKSWAAWKREAERLQAIIDDMALVAMDSETVEMPLDYLQGHKDGLEWAAQLAEANHPETGDWLYDDPTALAKAIRKGPDMQPVQPVADSEPVIVVGDDGGDALSYRRLIQSFEPGTKLYRHAQQPVVGYVPLGDSPYDVPCSMPSNLREFIDQEIGILFSDDDAQGVWIACRRAAMLQAGTLTNEGTKQAWTGIPDIDNAINMLDRIDTLESCDDDRIEAVKTVLRGLAGNSPVIPDGYVMVPKEMTDEIGEAIAMQANCCGGIALDIYDAMLAAATHDTPALNSLQSVDGVTGGWIPVSERMPDENAEQQVLACFKGGDISTLYYFEGRWDDAYGIVPIRQDVTHWMPLPAAPREVQGE